MAAIINAERLGEEARVERQTAVDREVEARVDLELRKRKNPESREGIAPEAGLSLDPGHTLAVTDESRGTVAAARRVDRRVATGSGNREAATGNESLPEVEVVVEVDVTARNGLEAEVGGDREAARSAGDGLDLGREEGLDLDPEARELDVTPQPKRGSANGIIITSTKTNGVTTRKTTLRPSASEFSA